MSIESDQNLIGIIETDVEIEGTAEEFFDIFTEKPNNISNSEECELQEGEWGTVGSILNWTYHHDGQNRTVKERIEAIDKENHLIKLRVLGGDIAEHFNSLVVTLQGVTKRDNPKLCVIHWHFEYEKYRAEIVDPRSLLQLAIKYSKEIEAHIGDSKAS